MTRWWDDPVQRDLAIRVPVSVDVKSLLLERDRLVAYVAELEAAVKSRDRQIDRLESDHNVRVLRGRHAG